jgi:hypothetical protein
MYIKRADVEYGFNIKVDTSALALTDLAHDQLYRLNTMQQLQATGFSAAEIAHRLNQQNIVTPTGQQYYPKLVWVTLDKFRKREARANHAQITLGQDYFFIKASPANAISPDNYVETIA